MKYGVLLICFVMVAMFFVFAGPAMSAETTPVPVVTVTGVPPIAEVSAEATKGQDFSRLGPLQNFAHKVKEKVSKVREKVEDKRKRLR